MIQKCPKCGVWFSAMRTDVVKRAVDGYKKAGEFGGIVGKAALGKPGELLGKLAGTYYGGTINAAYNAVFGDEFRFVCPDCRWEWSAKIDYDKEKELLNEVNNLLKKVPEYRNATEEEKEDCIASLKAELKKVSSVADKKFEAALTIGLDYVLGKEGYALDCYEKLKSLVCYKEAGGECRFLEKRILQGYIDGFLQIPYNKRHFLVIVRELNRNCFLGSFNVMPYESVPSGIIFPAGHYVDNVLYICHPYRQNHYLPFEDYQATLFEDELDEYKKLLQGLGAKTIEIEEVRKNYANKGLQEKLHGVAGGEYQGIDLNVEGDVSSKRLKHETFLKKHRCKILLDKVRLPYVPEGLVWYDHRPKWQSLVENRLERGKREFEEIISTKQEVSALEKEMQQVSTDLETLVASGSVSGKHESKKNYSFSDEYELNVKVEFYPKESDEKKWFDWILPKKGRGVF